MTVVEGIAGQKVCPICQRKVSRGVTRKMQDVHGLWWTVRMHPSCARQYDEREDWEDVSPDNA